MRNLLILGGIGILSAAAWTVTADAGGRGAWVDAWFSRPTAASRAHMRHAGATPSIVGTVASHRR